MEPFKNKYNNKSIKLFTEELSHENFNTKDFLEEVLSQINSLEMKERVDLISKALFKHFNLNYSKKIKFIVSRLDSIKEIEPFLIWPLTNYVALYGLDELKASSLAMLEMTKRFSSEFVIRYFIIRYEKLMYSQYISKWIKDDCEHVRRLATEGTRPRLPWGIKVQYINDNLKQNINLLNKLKNDESLYVRKSVANHFNDISHLDPDLVLDNLLSWDQSTKEQKWIIKRASRTLLKKGNAKALKLNGYDINPKIELTNKLISKKKIKEGDTFEINFKLINLLKKSQKLSIDYIIYYPKKNGELSPKVFKLKDIELFDEIALKKNISFKKVTTRVHYPGIHKIEIKISNKIYPFGEFSLKSD